MNNNQPKKEVNPKNENILSITELKDNQFLSSAMMVNISENFNNIDIHNESIEDLQLLLKYNLNKLFKKFIHNSKEAKLQVEGDFEAYTTKIDQDFSVWKINTLKEHEVAFEKLKKELELINNKTTLNKNRNSEIKFSVKSKTESISKKKNLLIAENKYDEEISNEAKYTVALNNLENQLNSSEDIDKDALQTKGVLKSISKNIYELKKEKTKIIEKMNNLKMDFTNTINDKYIFKEEQKTKLEMNKIEVFIFMRNNLLLINRHIRNVKIQLAIKNIEEKWRYNERIVENIDKTSRSIKKEFDLFDNITDNENATFLVEHVDTNTRIINLKTYEEN